jgi:phosphoribosylglycinamide formyltransferase-1
VNGKPYAYFLDNHHADGVVSACFKVEKEEQSALVKSDPARLFVPPYLGPRGWVGARLDVPRVKWADIAARIGESYRRVASHRQPARGVDRAARARS